MEIKADHVRITGGRGDIGLGIANALVGRGKRITLADQNISTGETLAAEHDRTSLIELDLAEAEAVAIQGPRSGPCQT
ncbi:MAG: hypothetical protein F4X97_12230 [Boseongicola sp. SB0662_bin_57]|nr:hypothetical protein [Boseongicola sp. SB0662_bin_57]